MKDVDRMQRERLAGLINSVDSHIRLPAIDQPMWCNFWKSLRCAACDGARALDAKLPNSKQVAEHGRTVSEIFQDYKDSI